MVRTALFGLAAVLGLAVPLAARAAVFPGLGPTCPPATVAYHPPACCNWQVLYHRAYWEPWRVYGTYLNERLARHAAHELRADGLHVRVATCG
jgi:hypothetical protein